jgi:biopolymer transport protein ExbB/TolQ
VRQSVKEYVRKPFATFLTEEDGYPRLKSVMLALSRAVSTGKLALKAREAKKVVERSEQVVSGNSLRKIHEEARGRKKTHDQFLADSETAARVQQLKDLRKRGRENHALREGFKSELQRALDNEKHSDEQIQAILHEIESFSRKVSGEDLRLQLSQ